MMGLTCDDRIIELACNSYPGNNEMALEALLNNQEKLEE